MSSRRTHRSGFGDPWFDRSRSGFALLVTLTIGIAALVVASVIGNRINHALPRGLGLVGMAVTVGLVGPVLVVLIAPARMWQRARIAVEQYRVRRSLATSLVETQCDASYDHSTWLVDDDMESKL